MTLANKTVVVLGGSSGIGLATAKAAKAEGADVVITGRSQPRLDAARAEIGGEVRAVALDVADENGMRALFGSLPKVDHIFVSAATVTLGGGLAPGHRKAAPRNGHAVLGLYLCREIRRSENAARRLDYVLFRNLRMAADCRLRWRRRSFLRRG